MRPFIVENRRLAILDLLLEPYNVHHIRSTISYGALKFTSGN